MPLDGSTESETILPLVRKLSVPDIVLLRVVETIDGAPPEDSRWSEYREYLDRIDLPGRRLVEGGPPAKTILQVAAQEGVSAIAMSTHGRSGIRRAILGSVAVDVLRSAEVPVILCRGTTTPRLVRKILVPLGGGEASLCIVPKVAELARLFEAEVLLLHVSEPGGEGLSLPLVAADRLAKEGVRVKSLFERGKPSVVILDAAKFREVDLIAMTTHARRGIPRMVLGSVTEEVLQETPVAMFVLPAHAAPVGEEVAT